MPRLPRKPRLPEKPKPPLMPRLQQQPKRQLKRKRQLRKRQTRHKKRQAMPWTVLKKLRQMRLMRPKRLQKRRPKKQAPIFRMRDRRGMERVSLDAGDEEEEEEELKMDGESASKYAEYMSKTRRFTGIKVKDELGKERLSMDTVSTPNLTVSELKEELEALRTTSEATADEEGQKLAEIERLHAAEDAKSSKMRRLVGQKGRETSELSRQVDDVPTQAELM